MQYEELTKHTARFEDSLYKVFQEFLRFVRQSHKVFKRASSKSKAGLLLMKSTWKDIKGDLGKQITAIQRCCKTAEREAQLAISKTSLERLAKTSDLIREGQRLQGHTSLHFSSGVPFADQTQNSKP